MKCFSYVFCLIISALSILLAAQLDHANREISRLNSQVNTFETKALKDGELIELLKAELLKKLHPKKKVICLDLDHAA